MSLAGKRIKEFRIKNHLTQEDVAKKLGVGKQAVYKYETGAVTNIPLENLVVMAEMFGTVPEYLAGWTDCPNSPDETSLSPVEQHLIDVFRLASPKYKSLALELLEEHPAFSEASEKSSLSFNNP